MKIVVIGGTGLIGSRVVSNLIEPRARGHRRRPHNSGVNTITGEGLADVLVGANVSSTFELAVVRRADALEFFTTRRTTCSPPTRGRRDPPCRALGRRQRTPARQRLPAGQGRTGAAHRGIGHALLDRASDPVLRVRRAHRRCGDRRTPSGSERALMQPIAAADVSAAVATVATGSPVNRVVEFAGPEQFRLEELVSASSGSVTTRARSSPIRSRPTSARSSTSASCCRATMPPRADALRRLDRGVSIALPRLGPLQHVVAGVLDVAYFEAGPATGHRRCCCTDSRTTSTATSTSLPCWRMQDTG